MSHIPNKPLLLASVQRDYMRLMVTRYSLLVIVSLCAGAIAVFAIVAGIAATRELNTNAKPFGYILIAAGLMIAFILLTNWISALRQRPAEVRLYEDGITLHDRRGEQFAAYSYGQVRNFSVVKVTPTLYTFLFGLLGALLGPLFGSFASSAMKAGGEWLDYERDKQIESGSERDIARTQIVILFNGAKMPYTINRSFAHFNLILEYLPPLIAKANPAL